MSRWYVVSTLPRQEARAEANLHRQGYRAWLPAIRRSRRHARRVDTVRAPLFPGYLFIELDIAHELWSAINGTFGVRNLLCHGDRPVPVPEGFVEALRGTVDESGEVDLAETIRPGERVRLLAGPFADCVGTLGHLGSGGRVAVLLELLGGKVEAQVPRRMLAPAG